MAFLISPQYGRLAVKYAFYNLILKRLVLKVLPNNFGYFLQAVINKQRYMHMAQYAYPKKENK